MVRLGMTLIVMAQLAAAAAGEARAQEAEQVQGGGGLTLAVYEGGNPAGPPIVFIHGFTGTHMWWDRQFSGALADEFRLVAYELRGHGASEQPLDPEAYTDSELWAEDLAAVIRAKELDRPVLVGWSYGGFVMADYVRLFGQESLGGLVFLAAVTNAGTEEAQGLLGEEALELFGGVLSPDVRTRIGSTRAFMRMLTAKPMDRDSLETGLAGSMIVSPEVRLALFSRQLENDDVLARIRVPTLVVQGEADRVVRMAAAEHIAATVPGAALHVYDGIGHAPHYEDAARFNRDLAAFVRDAHRDPSN